MTYTTSNSCIGTGKDYSIVLIMTCIYIFLFIERPWETISYLKGIPIERTYAILMILVSFCHGKFVITASPVNKWVYGLLLIHFLLAPFAFLPGAAVDQGVEFAKAVVLYLLMLSVADTPRSFKILLKTYAITMVVYILHSLWEYHNGRHQWRMGISRMMGVDESFGDPNGFGASIVLSLPIIYSLLRYEPQRWMRYLYSVYFILAILCVILTGSRSAFMVLAFSLIVYVLTQKGRRLSVMLIIAGVLSLVVWTVMPDEKQERIRSLWDDRAGPANAHASAKGRLIGWKVSWKMFKQKPLTGVGPGGENYIRYRIANGIDEPGPKSPTQAHNLYGQVLAEFGIVGAFMFIGLIASMLRSCLATRSRLHALQMDHNFFSYFGGVIIVCTLELLIFGLGGHNFYRPLWLWLAAWSGSLSLIAKKLLKYEPR